MVSQLFFSKDKFGFKLLVEFDMSLNIGTQLFSVYRFLPQVYIHNVIFENYYPLGYKYLSDYIF